MEAFHKWLSAVQITRAGIPTTVILVWYYEFGWFLYFSLKIGISVSFFMLQWIKAKRHWKEDLHKWGIHWILIKNPYHIQINHGSLIQLLILKRMGKEGLEQQPAVFISSTKGWGKDIWDFNFLIYLFIIYSIHSKVLFQKITAIFRWAWPNVSS